VAKRGQHKLRGSNKSDVFEATGTRRKSSSTSRFNQIKLKLIKFTGRLIVFSTGWKPIACANGDPSAIGKSKQDLRDWTREKNL